MKNIERYYKNTADAKPNYTVKKFIELNVEPGNAIELGCGAGRDTVCLIKNGWNVLAIDREDVESRIAAKLEAEELKQFKFLKQKFEDIELEKNNLVVANLEYISSEPTIYGPMIKQTEQKYIFELLNENGKIRYREIFTGFVADAEESHYFDLPYVVNIVPLKEQVPDVADNIPKYGLLLVLNAVNTKKISKTLKK